MANIVILKNKIFEEPVLRENKETGKKLLSVNNLALTPRYQDKKDNDIWKNKGEHFSASATFSGTSAEILNSVNYFEKDKMVNIKGELVYTGLSEPDKNGKQYPNFRVDMPQLFEWDADTKALKKVDIKELNPDLYKELTATADVKATDKSVKTADTKVDEAEANEWAYSEAENPDVGTEMSL